MTIALKEISASEIVGLNKAAVSHYNLKNLSARQIHQVVRPHDLASSAGGVFFQFENGYAHLPIEKMASLLLYRIAEGQFFKDGNRPARYGEAHSIQFVFDNILPPNIS